VMGSHTGRWVGARMFPVLISPRVVGWADGTVVLASACPESKCARPNVGMFADVELVSVREPGWALIHLCRPLDR
jgi:hypothetical protein